MNAYEQGFIDKCAAYQIEPLALLKYAAVNMVGMSPVEQPKPQNESGAQQAAQQAEAVRAGQQQKVQQDLAKQKSQAQAEQQAAMDQERRVTPAPVTFNTANTYRPPTAPKQDGSPAMAPQSSVA